MPKAITKKRREGKSGRKLSPETEAESGSVVAGGTAIEGDIHCSENIRVDGKIIGNLHCKGRVFLGQDGAIVGDVEAANAVVLGSVSGSLNVKGHLQLGATARIQGDIVTETITVDKGAAYNGQCKMG
ncbi:MAG: polymer-forming cytoskeletal protein [Saprospiraceae bacterium]|nr:polymer-forming cytoskeletal protein [Saprospiraceae bacterium]